MADYHTEKRIQEGLEFSRSAFFSDYNAALAYYQAKSCLEHARGGSLLDLPCGDGSITAHLRPHFKRVVGVDASAAHLAEARRRLPGVELREDLIETLEIRERFDTIAMLNILEHVLDPVVAIGRAARFLEDDGILIAHVPNAEAVNRRIAVLMGTLEEVGEMSPFDVQVAGHRRYYTLDVLCRDLEAAGLRIHATGGVFYKMLSSPQMDWLLKNGPWEEGGYGWGRVGGVQRDWKAEFCRACYEFGRRHPQDCNIVFATATR
jgi:2-polyprenyl-3-methyl-5-hydroxy-6-metoxy-1,4-benzoquinol methylase